MEKQEFTRLTLESSYGSKTIVEFDNEDMDAYELTGAFFTCMVGATFVPVSILEAMRDFAENNLEVLNPTKTYGED